VITAAVIAVYVVGFVVTYRKAYVVISEDSYRTGFLPSEPDPADKYFIAALAIVAALVWLPLCVGYGIYRTLTPVTPRERKADLDAREREIERLERELGIKRDE
jgi:hypothetical protein